MGGFQTSASLSNAYSVAVATIMVLTTVVIAAVAARVWNWHAVIVFAVFMPIFVVDVNFWASTLHKIPVGGWLPLLIGVVLSAAMLVYQYGRVQHANSLPTSRVKISEVLEALSGTDSRYSGSIGIFMCGLLSTYPQSLSLLQKLRIPFPETVVLLSVHVDEAIPYIGASDRFVLTVLEPSLRVFHVRMRLGFADDLASVGSLVEHYVVHVALSGSFANHPESVSQSVGDEGRERRRVVTFFHDEPTVSANPDKFVLHRWAVTLFAGMESLSTNYFALYGLPASSSLQISTHVEL